MSTVANTSAKAFIDNHKFVQASRTIQNTIVEATMEKAQQAGQKCLKKREIHRISNKLVDQAFEEFKTAISTQFPDSIYKNLVQLTLMARKNYFFCNLYEDVKNTLEKKKISTASNELKENQ